MLYGQEDKLSQVLINGKAYTPEISFSKTKNSARYVITVPDINVVLNLQIKVISNIVELNVTRIAENGSFKVNTFEIPDHNLVTVRSAQPGATFSGAKMYTAVKGSGDVFIPLTNEMATDSIPKDFLYSIINDNKLAVSIWITPLPKNQITAESRNRL